MPRKRKQKITPRALLELKAPGEVQVAPDGGRIAYSVSQTDWDDNQVTQHLYVTTTAEDSAPRQVTRGLDSEAGPRWSPDGKWLAFLTPREDVEDDYDEGDDDPKQQVFLLPMDGGGGEAEKLTSAPEGVETYEWLPDSSGLVYLAREPRPRPLEAAYQDKQDAKDDVVVERLEKFRQQIWRIDRENKKARLVHPGDFGIGEIAVSPDGRLVAFTTNYTGEVNDYHKADVWTVEMATGALRQLTDGPGGKYHPVWTPDGQAVLFTRTLDPALSYSQENLFSVPAQGGEISPLTFDFPHDLAGWHGVWFDAAGALYVSVALGTTTAVFRRGGDGFQPLVQSEEHIHGFHVAPQGGVAYVASSAAEAPELFWLGPDAAEPEQLTDLNDDWHEKYEIAPVELVSWQSKDGRPIEGLLTLPLGYEEGKPSPLLLYLHGGPHGRAVEALTPYTSAQVYAAAGYAVLSPNYRGSEGYGEEFGTANKGDLGGGDYEDVMAGVDWAVAEGIADPERLAVTGSSYGGYLTNWIVGHTQRFKAAISAFGIFSLVTDFSNSQAPRWELEYLGGFPWDSPALYAAQSPATFVKDIRTPVLILHGDGDPNTFITNSQEMYTALRLQGRTVEYAHYPREGHGFGEPQHRLDEYRRCLRWLDTHVLGAGQPVTYRIGDKVTLDGWELTVTHAELPIYAGRGDEKKRYLEVAFVLRDVTETRRPLTVGPADMSLSRVDVPGRPVRPVGLPVDVLGEKVLAEGAGWRFAFAPSLKPDKNERGLAVPLALAFRIGSASGAYALKVLEFPAVTIDVPAADTKDEDKVKTEKEEPEGRPPGPQ